MTDIVHKHESPGRRTQPSPSLFSIPPPLKLLFDRVPLITYAPNEQPARSSNLLRGLDHKLFIWTSSKGAEDDAASFNPSCLKWQVYLLFHDVPFRTVPSNNHASPSGQLPFVIAGTEKKLPFDGSVVSTTELQRWAKRRDTPAESLKLRHDVYMSLVDGPIRRAWLFHMYLTPNFELFTVPCYINTQSSSPIVRASNTHELRKAAERELLKHSPKIDRQSLYDEARRAFGALDWYCHNKFYVVDDRKPTLLDAAIFAYACLLWDIDYGCWADNELVDMLHTSAWILKVYDLLFQEHGLTSRLPLSEHYAVLEQSLKALHRPGSTSITYKVPAAFTERRAHKQR